MTKSQWKKEMLDKMEEIEKRIPANKNEIEPWVARWVRLKCFLEFYGE